MIALWVCLGAFRGRLHGLRLGAGIGRNAARLSGARMYPTPIKAPQSNGALPQGAY
jgi:hypothetical protein